MADLRFAARLSSSVFGFHTGITDLTTAASANGAQLYVTTRVNPVNDEILGGLSVYEVNDQSAARLISQEAFGGGVSHLAAPKIVTLSYAGGKFVFPTGLQSGYRASYELDEGGAIGARMVYAAQNRPPADLLQLVEVNTGNGTYIIAHTAGRYGLGVYQIDGTGGFALIDQQNGAGFMLADMAAIRVNGTSFVVGASAAGDAIISYRLDNSGRIHLADSLESIGSGIGFDTAHVVATVAIADTPYVVLGGAGSSSLTVLRIEADGKMVPVEHLVDGRDTRFQGVSALEIFTIEDRVFVLAGGADDGVTLMTMMQDGRLIHIQTLEDTDTITLQNVTAIAAIQTGNSAQIFITSEAEEGITQFSFDLGTVGATLHGGAGQLVGSNRADVLTAGTATTQIIAGAGDDILLAGSSTQSLRMQGGTGADIFVAAHNGQTMRIDDFEVGVDRLDLSMIPMLRSLEQLNISSNARGATLRFGDTVIDVRSRDGGPIATEIFRQADVLALTRYTPFSGTQEISGSATGERLVLGGPGGTVSALGGNDTITSSWGDATIDAGSGNDWIRAGSGSNQIWGGTGDDTVYGGEADDQIWGGAGNDYIEDSAGLNTIYTGEGRDEVRGGRDRDLIVGQGGPNRLFGNDGNDWIRAGSAGDLLAGGNGDDVLLGGVGNDAIYLGLGNDQTWGGAGDDYIDGGAGLNTIYTGEGRDEVRGGRDRDLIVGQGGPNRLFGNDGNDWIRAGSAGDLLAGGNGDDMLLGGAGADEIYLGLGNDTAWGDDGNDYIDGGAGLNTIYTGGGSDVVQGGRDRDLIVGQGGPNWLFGNDGNDWIRAGSAGDLLSGGRGDDVLLGGAGNDRIQGGTGRDHVEGGGGADVFVFVTAADAGFGATRDYIADFTPGEDKIDLSAMGMVFDSGGRVRGPSVSTIDGFILGDVDGDGYSDFHIQVWGAGVLGEGDFIL